MPFNPSQASKYKKGLSSRESRKRWSDIANSVLDQTGDESKAIKIANSKSKGSSPVNRDTVLRRMKRKGVAK